MKAYIKHDYALGEVCEFDWKEVKLTIAGKLVTLQMAISNPCRGFFFWYNIYVST